MLIPLYPVEASTFGDWQYTDNGTTITITRYLGSESIITIPESIDGKPVTSIGDSAFHHNNSLTSVVIPNGVTSIGKSAFNWCNNLTTIVIPNSVTTIGDWAFFASGLISVTIPNSVTTIGDSAFESCLSLTNITIPNSVTTIGESAFALCYSLTSVTIPGSVKIISATAFKDCISLTDVRIQNGVNVIGNNAFRGCINLATVTIPNSVVTIENLAFERCASLTEITIPDSVTSIGHGVFIDCTSLYTVTMNSAVPPTVNTWFGTSPPFLNVRSGARLVLPDGVTTYGAPGSLWYGLIVTNTQTPIVPVVSISGVPLTGVPGVPLQLTGTVNPANATGKEIVWSIVNAGTTGASIPSGSNTLNSTAAGTVRVRATIANGIALGTPYIEEFNIILTAVTFLPSPDGYSFTNNSASFGYRDNYRIPIDRFVSVYGPVDGEHWYNEIGLWGGSCFGMSVTAVLFNQKSLLPSSYSPGATTTYSIPMPRDSNHSVTRLIEQYQISWYKDYSRNWDNINGLISAVQSFQTTGRDPVVLFYYDQVDGMQWSDGGGHAVVAYRVDEEATRYVISLYDNWDIGRTSYMYIPKNLSNLSEIRLTNQPLVRPRLVGFIRESNIRSVFLASSSTSGNNMILSVSNENARIVNAAGIPLSQITGANEIESGPEMAFTSRVFSVPQGTYRVLPSTVSSGQESLSIGLSDSEQYVSLEIDGTASGININLGDNILIDVTGLNGEMDVSLTTISMEYSDKGASVTEVAPGSYTIEIVSQDEILSSSGNVFVEGSTEVNRFGANGVSMNFSTRRTTPVERPSPWAVGQVDLAIRNKLVPMSLRSGYTRATTRAEFCALAVALYETEIGLITGREKFIDTNDENVEKMAFLGVVNGVGNGRFDPNASLTREQAATMLARLAAVAGKPFPQRSATFADRTSIASWALDSTGQVQGAGIMDGIGNNMFSPKGAYTREQSIATMLRVFNYKG